jgi:MoaA/NifB/PqqE/SkfB family radical SAM enzyme
MINYIAPRTKVLAHPDKILDLKIGRRPAPINVEWDLSNRCSLGCEWCHFAYTHTRGPLTGKRSKPLEFKPGGDLAQTYMVKDGLEQLKMYGVKSVTWSGGGEPTLHPDFDEIIRSCRLDQGIYTHGGHIDKSRAALLKNKMTWVYVSLDAANRENYKEQKGVDYFDRAIVGIKRLVESEGKATIGVGQICIC